jgi:cysteine-rich repeat protein
MPYLQRTPLALTALLHLAACGGDPPATSGTDATSTADTSETTSGDLTTTDAPATASETGVGPTGDPTTDAPTSAGTDGDAVCGDDSVGDGEDCDDGNTDDGDGCSAACVREPGWQCDGSPSVCSDIDECADALDDCGDDATCTNTPGGWECACDPGFEGDGKRCEPAGAMQVVTGDSHTCALLDGRVKCWGSSHYGQLGLGDDESRGNAPGEMGDALPYVDLGADAVVVALAAQAYHTCAALESGAVKCWGRNIGGELGLGDSEDRGDDPDETGDALPVVDLGAGAHAVAVTAGLRILPDALRERPPSGASLAFCARRSPRDLPVRAAARRSIVRARAASATADLRVARVHDSSDMFERTCPNGHPASLQRASRRCHPRRRHARRVGPLAHWRASPPRW